MPVAHFPTLELTFAFQQLGVLRFKPVKQEGSLNVKQRRSSVYLNLQLLGHGDRLRPISYLMPSMP